MGVGLKVRVPDSTPGAPTCNGLSQVSGALLLRPAPGVRTSGTSGTGEQHGASQDRGKGCSTLGGDSL